MSERQTERTTTKVCPRCGNTHLALLRTENAKVCMDCPLVNGERVRIPWYLEPGQKPI